mmetsp:Transcript_67110/g.184842  ORF Transcript_67110/g.184842 Transcript_67110/m.184842 type:complete len:438 (+) Transcript_67110:3268-4581(+)
MCLLGMFSVSTLWKVHTIRADELKRRDDVFTLWNHLRGFDGYVRLFWVYIVLSVYFVLGMPVFIWRLGLVASGSLKLQQPSNAPNDSFNRANQVLTAVFKFEEAPWLVWLCGTILHDPLTFVYLPKSWRTGVASWIDLGSFGCMWYACVASVRAEQGYRGELKGDELYMRVVVWGVFLLWLKLISYLKGTSLKFATFILMLSHIGSDCREFAFVMACFISMFAHLFFLRAAHVGSVSLGEVYQGLYDLAFLGDAGDHADIFSSDQLLLDIFVFVIIVVLLNILIAIVSDSYDEAMARSRNLFWFARLKIVTRCNVTYGDLSWVFPNPNGPAILEENLIGEATKEKSKLGRTQDIVERVRHNMSNQMARAEDQHSRTQTALMAALTRLEAKVDALEAAQAFSEMPSRGQAYSEMSFDASGSDVGVARGTRPQRPMQVL